jgi:hypothetical protein
MAYDYDADILGDLWTGVEDTEEPYAAFIAANPTLTDDAAENRILSTVEALRAHMALLKSRDEARLFHFCVATMLEGFGSGGFVYGENGLGAEDAVVEGNIVEPTFDAGDDIEFYTLDGVSAGVLIAEVDASGGDLDSVITDINGNGSVTGAGILASRTQNGRLRLTQAPVAGTAADGFVITFGEGADNDNIVKKAGIDLQKNANVVEAGLAGLGAYFIAKVTEVANNCRDRALAVFEGQARDTDFS